MLALIKSNGRWAERGKLRTSGFLFCCWIWTFSHSICFLNIPVHSPSACSFPYPPSMLLHDPLHSSPSLYTSQIPLPTAWFALLKTSPFSVIPLFHHKSFPELLSQAPQSPVLLFPFPSCHRPVFFKLIWSSLNCEEAWFYSFLRRDIKVCLETKLNDGEWLVMDLIPVIRLQLSPIPKDFAALLPRVSRLPWKVLKFNFRRPILKIKILFLAHWCRLSNPFLKFIHTYVRSIQVFG